MKTFQRNLTGKSTYTCLDCGKLTRETGHSESSCELCLNCFNRASLENEHSDHGHDVAKKNCPTCECEAEQVAENAVAATEAPVGNKRFAVKTVTKALKAAGINGEFVRGNGYYYFTGPAFDGCKTTTVIAFNINAYTVEAWVKLAQEFDAESANAAKEAAGIELVDIDLSKATLLCPACSENKPLLGSSTGEHGELLCSDCAHLVAHGFEPAENLFKQVVEQTGGFAPPASRRAQEDHKMAARENESFEKELAEKLDALPKADMVAPTSLRTFALVFYEIEHYRDLQEVYEALTTCGCTVLHDETVHDFDNGFARVKFTTRDSLKEIRLLLENTNVIFS